MTKKRAQREKKAKKAIYEDSFDPRQIIQKLKRAPTRRLLTLIAVVLLATACGGFESSVPPEPAGTGAEKTAPNAHTPNSTLSTSSATPLRTSPGQRIRFERISLEQGLSQSTVHAIFQDSEGFMWFGTNDGLNKYDGYNFTVYRHAPENPHSLSNHV